MDPRIKLIAISGGSLDVPLKESFNEYLGEEPLFVVYQDETYSYCVSGDCFIPLIDTIDFYINDQQCKIDFHKDEAEENSLIIQHRPSEDKPFQLLFGVTNISMHIVYADKKEIYLFSSYLAIAVNEYKRDTINSISSMLEDIYTKDHALLHKQKMKTNSEKTKFLNMRENKFSEEIAVLKEIATELKKNLPYFMRSPAKTTITDYHIDDIERLHTVGSKNLEYIVAHPEDLRVSFSSGIRYGRSYVMPERTLVSTQQFTTNTVENTIVLSFIYTLLLHLNNRRLELEKFLENREKVQIEASDMRDNYVLSTTIINQFSSIILEEYHQSLVELSRQLLGIFREYYRIIDGEVNLLVTRPSPTPVFLEIHHYRSVFRLMNLWFATGDYTIPRENEVLHFSSADKIYEYYCLLNLYDILTLLGYSEQVDKRVTYNYALPFDDNKGTESNTYYFERDEEEVVLYYQPVIYSENTGTRNGITLFRTDKDYYTPDFIIRKTVGGNTTYAIIDAKWRTQSVLLMSDIAGGLREIVYKYQYSVIDEKNLESVRFLWLLQGRDDDSNSYYQNSGSISRSKSTRFQKSTGIIRLTPTTGNMDLLEGLTLFLEGADTQN